MIKLENNLIKIMTSIKKKYSQYKEEIQKKKNK